MDLYDRIGIESLRGSLALIPLQHLTRVPPTSHQFQRMKQESTPDEIMAQANLLLVRARAELVHSQSFYRKHGIDPARIEQAINSTAADQLKSRLHIELNAIAAGSVDVLKAPGGPTPARSTPGDYEAYPLKRKLRLRV
jgi:hypothetical protein